MEVYLDMGARTLAFGVNGTQMGVAFEALPAKVKTPPAPSLCGFRSC